MIFKQETQILKCTFEKEHFSKVKAVRGSIQNVA